MGDNMNIMHLKYAVEIAKQGSINKAADALLMGQPNLSRAIKELEQSLGITIFQRTTKGMTITHEGEEFLVYAKKILRQIHEVESIYKNGSKKRQNFSISVPRASYICEAFTKFSKNISTDEPAEIFYKETNSARALKNILEADYKLGIIRFAENYDKYFRSMLEEKELTYEIVTDFTYKIAMSADSPLAKLKKIHLSDLSEYIEISHADPYVPSLPMAQVLKEEQINGADRRILVFERASQFDLLSENTNTFMWVSDVPQKTLERFNLVQRECVENNKRYRDVLTYRRNYKLSKLDKMFIEELYKSKAGI